MTSNPVLKLVSISKSLTTMSRSSSGRDPHSYMINVILEHTVVERQEKCFSSAADLLLVVDTNLEAIKQGGQLLLDGIPRICHVCGTGHYTRQALANSSPSYNLRLWDSRAVNPAVR